MSPNPMLALATKRRTIYNLGKKLPKSNKEMTTLIKDVVRMCPSSFNVQSSRVVILYGAEHAKVWTIVKDAMKSIGLAGEQLQASHAKVDNCFAAGAGTVLFYEDTDAIKEQQKAFPTYAANFPSFSEHSSAIAQYAVWTALASEGVGASLQHYNELITPQLQEAFKLPKEWKLIAQMPFGSIEKPADAKTFIDDAKRFVVKGE